MNLRSLCKAIGPNTILIYASAPNYPQGVIDNVKEMSKIALKYKIGLHVDCCLGGFVLSFAKKLGYKIPGELQTHYIISHYTSYHTMHYIMSCHNHAITITNTNLSLI